MDASLNIIKPKCLEPNSLIEIIAPSGPVTPQQIERARQTLQNLGFRSVFDKKIITRKGYLAGDDKTRLESLHNAFANPHSDAIICIRGGYGSMRIVDSIDYELIRQNPKIFIGYSDITVLLNAIQQHTGLITFHGVVGISAFTEYTQAMFKNILSSPQKEQLLQTENPEQLTIIKQGKAHGRLAGGNLSMIVSLIGTRYQVDFTDKIVFLEDVGEAPYRIDRMLTQLLLSGCLQNAAGIVLGTFKGCDIDNNEITQENSLSLMEVITDRLSILKIPVITGFSFGHIENQAIFPVGIKAAIDTDIPGIKLIESPVI